MSSALQALRLLAFAAGVAGLAACAGGELADRNALLEKQMTDLRRQTDGDRQALRQLENRIFLLEDKADTAEVARGKVAGLEPHLPVVTKHRPDAPTAANDDAPIAIAAAELPAATAYDDGPLDDGPPLVLHMDGAGGHFEPAGQPRTAARDARRPMRSSSLPDLATVNERLPVVPLPKTTPTTTTTTTTATAPAPSDGEDPMNAYQEARAALGRHEHAAAIAGFKRFVEKWPSHDYADNAQYWLGEAYYDQADYRTALVEFRAVVQRYPAGNKAPDAMLKVGYCLAKLGDSAAAADVLVQVAQIYPKTDAARLAQKRLAEAGQGSGSGSVSKGLK
jgi:tol-pal system protein YbgF